MQQRPIVRTVQYWRLVDNHTRTPVKEQDWSAVLKQAYGTPITHRVLNKDLTCNVITLDIRDEWQGFVPPENVGNLAQDAHDETVYGVVVSTDKDHVPNQGNRGTGEQRPVTVDEGFAPIDNLFVWFLPFGNIFGILMESVSAAKPVAFATWLTRVMRDQGTLPQQNHQWTAVPVVDLDRKDALDRSSKLKSVFVAGTVEQAQQTPFADLFVGPAFDGAYEVQIKVKSVKKNNPASFEHDTEALKDWFDSYFGRDYGTLDTARVQFRKDPGDDLPRGEVDLLAHRLTRKRAILMRTGKSRSIVASSALSEIVNAYTVDFEELLNLR